MSDEHEPERHPDNAPGPFYIDRCCCLACGVTELVAPEVIGTGEDGYCFFRKQPSTTAELEQTLQAMVSSCAGSVRYEGNDPDVLAQITTVEEAQRQRLRPNNSLHRTR